MITRINESKTLTKHISCKCKCSFDGSKCDLDRRWNKNKCWCECKNPKEHNLCEKCYIWNLAPYSCKNGKYVGSITDDSLITCGEVKEKTNTVPKNFNGKKVTCKTKHFYILLAFLLTTVAFLIAASIYCYQIKQWSTQKTFFPRWQHKQIKWN